MSTQLKDTKADTQNLIELTKRLQLERYILFYLSGNLFLY